MSFYSQELVEEIRSRSDIVDVINSYVRLQRKGSNYVGVCPFHNDHSPSMSVNQPRQMYRCFSCGAGGDVLACKGRENNNPIVKGDLTPGYVSMEGQSVFKFAVKKVPECIDEVLNKAGKNIDDVELFVLHQANLRILTSISKRKKIPMDKIPVNLDTCGNTSAASVPILLDKVNKEGKIKENDLILLAGFGAGLTWGAALIQW